MICLVLASSALFEMVILVRYSSNLKDEKARLKERKRKVSTRKRRVRTRNTKAKNVKKNLLVAGTSVIRNERNALRKPRAF